MTTTAPVRGIRRGVTAAMAAMGLAALLLPAGPATAAETIPITVTAGHPPAFLWVKTLSESFIPGVNKRLMDGGDQYRIEWTEAYGGTVWNSRFIGGHQVKAAWAATVTAMPVSTARVPMMPVSVSEGPAM